MLSRTLTRATSASVAGRKEKINFQSKKSPSKNSYHNIYQGKVASETTKTSRNSLSNPKDAGVLTRHSLKRSSKNRRT
jgi:hypothetical protein